MENNTYNVRTPCHKSKSCRICFGMGVLAFLGICSAVVIWVLYAIGTS